MGAGAYQNLALEEANGNSQSVMHVVTARGFLCV